MGRRSPSQTTYPASAYPPQILTLTIREVEQQTDPRSVSSGYPLFDFGLDSGHVSEVLCFHLCSCVLLDKSHIHTHTHTTTHTHTLPAFLYPRRNEDTVKGYLFCYMAVPPRRPLAFRRTLLPRSVHSGGPHTGEAAMLLDLSGVVLEVPIDVWTGE